MAGTGKRRARSPFRKNKLFTFLQKSLTKNCRQTDAENCIIFPMVNDILARADQLAQKEKKKKTRCQNAANQNHG